MPRSAEAAAKPVMSPITPPPSASSTVELVIDALEAHFGLRLPHRTPHQHAPHKAGPSKTASHKTAPQNTAIQNTAGKS